MKSNPRFTFLQVEPYEPSNEYGFEYSFVTYGDVFYLLEETLKKNDRITRQEWIDIYQSRLKGTKEFAEEVRSFHCFVFVI